MHKELEKKIDEDVALKIKLETEVSEAIAGVLKNYGIGGKYIFNVRRDADYCHESITHIQGRQLVLPLWCIASGYSTVEEPKKVGPI